jgi:Coenzyme A transferase
MEPQTIIARRIARELAPGMLVNLGIGIPTLVANHLPEGMHVFFQSENGLIGTGAPPWIWSSPNWRSSRFRVAARLCSRPAPEYPSLKSLPRPRPSWSCPTRFRKWRYETADGPAAVGTARLTGSGSGLRARASAHPQQSSDKIRADEGWSDDVMEAGVGAQGGLGGRQGPDRAGVRCNCWRR